MAKIQAADMSFEVARLRALAPENWPHLGMALLAISAYKTDTCPTAAIDEWWRVYYNPDFIKKLGPQQAAGVFVHEIWHALRFHAIRARLTGVTWETHEIWNLVADAEIHNRNEKLLEALKSGPDISPVTVQSFDPPLDPAGVAEGWFLDVVNRPSTKRHQLPDGRVLLLPKMQGGYPDPNAIWLPGAGGGGSGSSGIPMPWEFPGPLQEEALGKEQHSGIQQERAGVIQRAVAEAIRQHSKSRGMGEGGLLRWAEELLDPKVDWRTKFQTCFQGIMAPIMGTEHWTWKRPSRRSAFDPRVILPGWAGSQRRVAVLIDTSGSMSDTMLARCRGECTNMISTLVTNAREPSVHVYTCDTRVSEAQRVWSGSDIDMIGGGGTDITIAFNRVLEDMNKGDFEYDIVVCMTDGYTPWPQESFPIPTVTMLVGKGQYPKWLDESPHCLVEIDPE